MEGNALTSPCELVLGRKPLSDIHQEIQDIYLANDYPWIIGYSGGKDSTATTQLIWKALSELHERELKKRIYVIASDTLVENPSVTRYIESTLEGMNEAAAEQGLPLTARKVEPQIEDTFWVNLIGKGYPAPYNRFRWCTDRLKIRPANRFILDTVSKHGEVIVVLGVRRGESNTRD
jgi:DNA sulfur modification protein DndC